MGLADAGAHVGQIIDASQPTYFLLTYWVRERGLLTVEEAIRRLTSDTATTFGIAEPRRRARRVRSPTSTSSTGTRSRSPSPSSHHDFPDGAGRFVQRAHGYDTTIVNGQVFMEDGEHTGALAGRLLRGV